MLWLVVLLLIAAVLGLLMAGRTIGAGVMVGAGAVMALAVWALMKSMSKHMNKVKFEESADAEVGATTSSNSSSEARGQDSRKGD